MHLTNVVLPAPLSPTSAVTSPAFAVKFTDDNTWTGPNDLSTPRSSSVGTGGHVVSPARRGVGLAPTRRQPHGSMWGHGTLMPLAVHSFTSAAVGQTAAAVT